uniref:Uncharacterized protein n=1 Tax=Lepeophtheirus salmonis TaxID=72036 RepID=A0A0K2UFE5_LEPSM
MRLPTVFGRSYDSSINIPFFLSIELPPLLQASTKPTTMIHLRVIRISHSYPSYDIIVTQCVK